MTCHYGFIGGGNMATAIVGGLLEHKICGANEILVSDVAEDRRNILAERFGVSSTESNSEVVEKAECVVLAVKPQILSEVAPEIAPLLREGQTLISILAGVTVEILRERLNGHERIVRVMPNLPATIGKGVAGIATTPSTPAEAYDEAEKLLGTVGGTVRVEEELLDAVTGVSGSGPGYVFRIAEILIQAGVQVGLTEDQSRSLVEKTLQGAAELLVASEESAGELCRRVCSPGGTTLAGLDAMAKGGIEAALTDGVRAARDRSRELSKG
jgi:pyrroline-5-carboxylate reductase